MQVFGDLFNDVDDVEVIVPDAISKVPEVKTELEGPNPGFDTGIANELLALINDENEAIRGYYAFKANLTGHEDFAQVIDDIAAEELNHVGMLQALLMKVSPNAATIDAGRLEAEQQLTEDVNDERAIPAEYEMDDYGIDDDELVEEIIAMTAKERWNKYGTTNLDLITAGNEDMIIHKGDELDEDDCYWLSKHGGF